VSQLLPQIQTLWVNTIGMRRPSMSIADLKKVWSKLRALSGGREEHHLPENLSIVTPRMYPGFRSEWQRRFNARRISSAVNRALGDRRDGECRPAITTLPITADISRNSHGLDVDKWVYYAVDDFSEWPGLDSDVMRQMEAEQLQRMDVVVAASEHLRDRLAGLGRGDVHLLTHGIDTLHWKNNTSCPSTESLRRGNGPVAVFWGLIDERLDEQWCIELAKELEQLDGTLVLIGPIQTMPRFASLSLES
jgi:hypothetical protein